MLKRDIKEIKKKNKKILEMKTTLSEINKKKLDGIGGTFTSQKKRLVNLKLEQYKWSKIEDRNEPLGGQKTN